jgi:hypothetical protein
MNEDKSSLIYALTESIELLREDNDRYRRSNSLLRRINSELRALKNIQAANDEEFKSACQYDLPFVDVTDGEDGLSDPLSS